MAELFQTARLSVRRITPDDFDAMYATYADPDAMRWVDDGQPISAEDCRRWIDVTLRNYATRGYGMSALCLREGGVVIGFCGLVHPGGQAEPEIKYALRRAYWGRGFATEAAVGMLGYGARALGIERVIATIAPANGASQRVLEKAGMAPAGVRLDEHGQPTAVYRWSAGG